MRHVFQFYGDPQVLFVAKAYQGSTESPPKWRGAFVEGLIQDTAGENDALYIEGDLESVKAALTEALRQIAVVETFEKERIQKQLKRTEQCLTCGRYFDTRYIDEGHGDGSGNKCYP